METREIEVSVISDLHLATHACKAKKILKYLKSIEPKTLVLNGDIIDSWRFSRNYFPKSHLKVVRHLIKMLEKGVEMYYITGNHDEFLRKFHQFQLGNLKLVNQLTLDLDGKKTWILHGDIFDPVISLKWLAKFGAASKGFLTMINKGINHVLKFLGQNEIIIYKRLRDRFSKPDETVSNFETQIAHTAIARSCDTVICGHTHLPKQKILMTNNGKVNYLNCGDWVESFSAAEYNNGSWSVFYYEDNDEDEKVIDEIDIPNDRELHQILYRELAMVSLK